MHSLVFIVLLAMLWRQLGGFGAHALPKPVSIGGPRIDMATTMEDARLLAGKHSGRRRIVGKKSDGFAWNEAKAMTLAQYTTASYCRDWPSISAWNCSRCTQPFQVQAVINDTAWNLFAYAGYSPVLESITVVFRGTDSGSLYNWITDISSLRTSLDVDISNDDGTPFNSSLGPVLVHSGFYRAYNESALKPGVRQAVADLLAAHGEGTPVMITGHSLGGALASIAAIDLHGIYGKRVPVRTYTFGSPRVGNDAFAAVYAAVVQESVRITHGRDVVPSLPYMYMGFRHVPWEVYLVDQAMPDGSMLELVQICNGSGEDPQCHDGACSLGLCTSVADHLTYLGLYMGANLTEC